MSELRAEFGLAYSADRRNRSFVLVHARGYPVGLAQREARLPADVDGPVARAARTGQPVEIATPEAWRREFPSQSDLPAMTGMRSLVAWPLGDVERRGGVLVVGWAVSGALDARTRELLSAMADQGGQALERAGLHAREREAQQLQEAFISVISHELRTPITTILAGSRLLRRQLEDGTTADELAADVEAEADRLFRIVEDLLVLSRLERRNLTDRPGAGPPRPPRRAGHRVGGKALADACASSCPTRCRPGSSAWSAARTPTSNRSCGTFSRTPRSTRRVARRSRSRSTTTRDGVAVRVLDDGPGIARAEVEQLFSLFYRSPATAASAAGAGIGLFVSRQLVDAMGGRMWARPRRKGGSEFGFSLAAYPYDEDEPATADRRRRWRGCRIRWTMAGDPWEDTTMTDERPLDNPNEPGEPADATGSIPPAGDASSGASEQPPAGRAATRCGRRPAATRDPDSAGSKMLGQLQTMIDQVATQARPMARQIGIKAAELTAIAADRAGPAAHKAGDVAADASSKLAVRSREFADALRRELGMSEDGSGNGAAADASSASTAVMDRVEDAADSVADSAKDAGENLPG